MVQQAELLRGNGGVQGEQTSSIALTLSAPFIVPSLSAMPVNKKEKSRLSVTENIERERETHGSRIAKISQL